MRSLSRALLIVAGLALVLAAPANARSSVKKAISNAKQAVAVWTLVPKFDLGGRALYEIRADGTPLDVEQGKAVRDGLAWVPEDMKTEACLAGGTSYRKGDGPKWRNTRSWMGTNVKTRVVWFYIKAKRQVLEVMVQSCVRFNIHYDRTVTADDLEPAALARALGGFFDISGPNLPGISTVDERLREALGSSESAAVPTATRPVVRSEVATIAGVRIKASPIRVRRGEPVEMILRYDVLSPNSNPVDVSQSWTLLFDGKALPTYPTERRVARSRGSFESALQQVIPDNAPSGRYKLKGEVCVLEDCSTRTTSFEVLP